MKNTDMRTKTTKVSIVLVLMFIVLATTSFFAQAQLHREIKYKLEKNEVYFSEDQRSTWHAVRAPKEVSHIAWDRKNSEHIIAVTRGGIYLSQDGAQSWQLRLWRPINFITESLEYLNGTRSIIQLTGTLPTPDGQMQKQRWRSLDGGISWQESVQSNNVSGSLSIQKEGPLHRSTMVPQLANGDTSGGIAWGPIIKISQDASGSGGNYIPHLAVQGDTIHCTWYGGQFLLPYIRSTTDGLTWESPRELWTDSIISTLHADWIHVVVNSGNLYMFFNQLTQGVPSGQGATVYYIYSTDRGDTWSQPIRATTDTTGPIFSASVRGDTMVGVYVPYVSGQGQYPRITRSTNGGISWTKNPFRMPSSSSNQLRVALTPGLLNFFHPGDQWPGPAPEIVLHRSSDLADTWRDSVVLSPIDGNGSDMPEVASYERFGTGDAGERTTLGVMWRGEEFTGAGFSAGMALRFSYDNGKIWQPMQIVSDTPRGSFHALAIKENIVAVSWQDELGDFGPMRVKARISFDCGTTWKAVSNLTPTASGAGVPSIALSSSAAHVAWEEYIDGKWNIYYRRGELMKMPLLSRTSIEFDSIAVGCSRNETVTVRNNLCDPLNLTAIVSNEQDFSIIPNNATIQPRDSVMLTVRFNPLSLGNKSSFIVLLHTQVTSPDTITLSAYAEGTGSEIAITDSVGTRWRMISVPVESHCITILPGSFLYHGSYQLTDTLLIGEGYWNKLNNLKISFAGYAVGEETIGVRKGWNMIGSITRSISVNDIKSIPGGITTSDFYGYDGNNYYITDSIYPARAYWVKVSDDASLILSASLILKSLDRIMITNANETPPKPPEAEIVNPISPKSENIPNGFALEQNYPNPFNPSTIIKYRLPSIEHVTIKVYDIFGREVATLVSKDMQAGEHTVEWFSEGFSSGVYFCRLQTNKFTETQRLILIK